MIALRLRDGSLYSGVPSLLHHIHLSFHAPSTPAIHAQLCPQSQPILLLHRHPRSPSSKNFTALKPNCSDRGSCVLNIPNKQIDDMVEAKDRIGEEGIPTFSLISRALLHSGSASLYLPRLPYSTARLFKVAATWRERAGNMIRIPLQPHCSVYTARSVCDRDVERSNRLGHSTFQ